MREVVGIGAAATECLEVAAVPVAAAARPRRAKVTPVGEVGIAGDASAFAPARAEADAAQEGIVADVVFGIGAHRVELAVVLRLVVEQEPVEVALGIFEIGGIGNVVTRRQELHLRGFARVIDEQVRIGLHGRDEAVERTLRTDPLPFEVHPETVGQFHVDIDRDVFGHGVVLLLEAQQFGGNAGDAAERIVLRQDTALEHVAVEHRGGAGAEAGEQAVVVDQCQGGEFLQRAVGFGAQVFCRQQEAAVGAFELADRRKGLPVAAQVSGANAGTLGNDDRAGGREVGFIVLRRAGKAVGADRLQADTAAAEIGIAVAWIGDLRSVGARHQFLLRIAQLQAEGADTAVEGGRPQHREAGRPFLGHVAVVHFGGAGDVEAGIVERVAGDEVDRARDAAVDHVGSGVLEHFDPAQQFGRNVVERQLAAAVGREDVTPVQFRTDIGQAADDHARTFDAEAVGIVALDEAADVDAGDALQGFGHRAIRQGADVFGGNHVDDGIGIFLEILRALQRGTEAADVDRVVVGFVFLRSILRFGVLRLGDRAGGHAQRQAGNAGKRAAAAAENRITIVDSR